MNISTKILAGFLAIIALLGVVAFIGIYSVNDIGDGFSRYRQLALQTNQSGRVQANMLTARLNVKNFIISATPEAIKGVEDRANATLRMIDELQELITHEDRSAIATHSKEDLEEYLTTFGEVTKLQDKRNDLVSNFLDTKGPEMERKLSEIMKSAKADGDADASYEAGITLRALLLARLYVYRDSLRIRKVLAISV